MERGREMGRQVERDGQTEWWERGRWRKQAWSVFRPCLSFGMCTHRLGMSHASIQESSQLCFWPPFLVRPVYLSVCHTR